MHKKSVEVSESRVVCVLRSPGMRLALAEAADRNELAPKRGLGFSSTLVAEHLGKKTREDSDAEFFSTRHVSEAIILGRARPVLLVRDGLVEKAPLAAVEKQLEPVRKKLVKPIGAIGRVELSDHDTLEWCGTGWRVEDDLIVTNRHVARIFAERFGATFRVQLNRSGKPVRPRIDFREEYRQSETEEFSVVKVLWIADDAEEAPDVAILQVLEGPDLPPPLELRSKAVEPGQRIGVVGYPAYDSRNDITIMDDLFGDIYDVKRFAPGEVVRRMEGQWFFTHDASTLGGNSGSAVLDLDSQQVVGLHFGGSFRKTNYAVKSSVIANILSRKTWSGVGGEGAAKPEAFQDKKRTKAYMADRKGYDASFLGTNVALPRPGSSHQVLQTSFPDGALPYTHFSIVMSSSRRLPIFTAENLDGSKKIKLKRKDAWGFDPRISPKQQVGHHEFYGPEPFDKGHMVRRENPGWGDTVEEARLGEEDSFVYTNAVPQMPDLNQRTWLSLEDYVLGNARVEGFKVCVFTGPVLAADDPEYSDVAVPRDFWKVVVAIDADSGKLLTAAYMLTQEGMLPEEGFRYGPFKTYLVPLSRVESRADLKFSKAVRDADVYGDEDEGVRFGLEVNGPENVLPG